MLIDFLYCETSAEQGRGHFYGLVIICIWPSGFRTVPRVALKTSKPWNAQSPAHSLSYQAKLLGICLSVSLCATPLCHHQPLTTKKVCFYACMMMFMSTRVHISISVFCVYCTPLADRWKPQAQRRGSLFEAPPHPPPLCTPQLVLPLSHSFSLVPLRSPSRKKASILHRQAPEPGCRQWKPSSVTTKRQI